MDNVLFSSLTMNVQPLHIDEEFASKTEFGQRIVNSLFTLGPDDRHHRSTTPPLARLSQISA